MVLASLVPPLRQPPCGGRRLPPLLSGEAWGRCGIGGVCGNCTTSLLFDVSKSQPPAARGFECADDCCQMPPLKGVQQSGGLLDVSSFSSGRAKRGRRGLHSRLAGDGGCHLPFQGRLGVGAGLAACAAIEVGEVSPHSSNLFCFLLPPPKAGKTRRSAYFIILRRVSWRQNRGGMRYARK